MQPASLGSRLVVCAATHGMGGRHPLKNRGLAPTPPTPDPQALQDVFYLPGPTQPKCMPLRTPGAAHPE